MRFTHLAAAAFVLRAVGSALFAVSCGTSGSGVANGGTGAGSAGDSSKTGSPGGGASGAGGTSGINPWCSGANSATGCDAGFDVTSGSPAGTSGSAAGTGGTSGAATGGSGAPAVDASSAPTTDADGDASGSAGPLPAAMPSPGCGTPAPADGAGTVDVSGTVRDYIMRLPAGYDPSIPYRIIFAFHGMQGSAQQVDDGDPPNAGLQPTGPYFGIKDQSNNEAIFVAGQALSGGWTNTNGQDISYVQALVTQLDSQLCVDESRVFATGFSFGAIMTITIGCTLPDIFRAIAPMSGSLANGCPASTHSIAYWASHGTMDTTIDISLGEAARDEFVQRNGCQSTTTPTTPDGCVTYDGCAAGYPVNWCPFDGIHEPPPFSGPAIWAFLSQF
jgi:polyhydroxybutyrate depolymerase